jgi:hypothetical protein
MSQKIICNIYRSAKREGLYLYVPKAKDLACVPEALLAMFGRPELAFSMLLTPERKLGKEDVQSVLNALDEKGYFLQMPPVDEDSYMKDINQHNHKMAK